MADLNYYESGYIDEKYFVYTADAEMLLGIYIDAGYIEDGYYFGDQAWFTLSAELTEKTGTVVEATGSWTSTASITATAYRIQSALSNQSSQFTESATVSKLMTGSSSISSAATVNAVPYKVMSLSADVGALFTPSVAVNVTVNPFSTIESEFTITPIPSVNRSITQILEALANLDAMAAKTADVTSAVTANASLTSTAIRIKSADASLSSEFAISADVQDVILFDASLNAKFTTYTTRYFGGMRPRNLQYTTYDTSVKKFGSASAITVGSTIGALNDVELIPEKSQDFVFEYWMYVKSSTVTTGTNTLRFDASVLLNGSSPIEVSDFIGFTFTGTTSKTIQFRSVARNAAFTDAFYVDSFTTSALSNDTWHHVAVAYQHGVGLSMWVDGSRVYNRAGSNTNEWSGYYVPPPYPPTQYGSSLGGQFITSSGADSGIRFDEVNFQVGTTAGYNPASTTITVPTTVRSNQTTTQMLYHLDQTPNDDISFLQSATASVNSFFTVSTQADPLIKSASASLSSAFTETVTSTMVNEGIANIASTSTLDATAYRTQEGASDVSAIISVNADATRIMPLAADFGALFTPDINIIVRTDVTISLDCQFTADFAVHKIAHGNSQQSSEFSLISDADTVVGISADISSAFSTAVAAERVRDANAQVDTNATLSADATNAIGFAVDITASASVDATAYRTQEGSSSESSEFTQTADVSRTRDESASISSEFAQSVDYIRYRDADSTQSSDFALTSTVYRIQDSNIDAQVEFTVSANGVKDTDVASLMASEFYINITAVKKVDAVPHMDAIATALAAVAINATGTVLLESRFTTSALIGKVTQATTILPPVGINFKKPASIGANDLGPALVIEPIPTISSSVHLMSFWLSADTTGVVFDGDWIDGFGPTNQIRVGKESGNYWLYYYGNDAAAQIYPYARWRLNYSENQPAHHYLLYINVDESSQPVAQNIQDMYVLYVDGNKQILDSVTGSYPIGNLRHPMTVAHGISLGSNLKGGYASGGVTPATSIWQQSSKISEPSNNPVLFQFWWDYGNKYDVNDAVFRHKFYPGRYVDYGPTGTSTGLPTPKFYARLTDYQDTLELGSTITDPLNNWDWRYLNNRTTIGGDYFYDVQYLTATTEQNGVYVPDNIVAVFDIDITLLGVILYGANLQSVSTLSANLTVAKGLAADITAVATVDTRANYTVDNTSTQASEFTQLTSETKYTGVVADFNSEFTQQTIPGQNQQISESYLAEFTLTSDISVIPPIRVEAALVSEFTQTANTNVLIDFDVSLTAIADIAADITVIPPIRTEAYLDASTELTVDFNRIRDHQFVPLDALTDITAAATATLGATSNLSSEFTESATVVKYTGIGYTVLQVNGFVLTAGDVINIDLFLTLRVEQETRTIKVLPESRAIRVEQETRVNIIQGY